MTYTKLPYSFDLLYDIKSVEELHGHLTGERRTATSATDAQLVAMMLEHDVPLPDGYAHPAVDLGVNQWALIEALTSIRAAALAQPERGEVKFGRGWILDLTAQALRQDTSEPSHERARDDTPRG